MNNATLGRRAGNGRRSLAIACALSAVTLASGTASAVSFTDPTGDNYGPAYVDIASVDVTNDAANITFQINLNPSADLLATDGSQIYGKYQIGFQTGEAGTTNVMNPYGNPIGISSGTGMDYWIGSWADNSTTSPFSGGAQLYHYAGDTPTLTAGIGTNSPYIELPVALAATSTSITVPLTSLGLAAGDSFKFDVWTTFGVPGGQSAYDALGKPTLTTDPGTPFSPVTPYDSGTLLVSYTVTGGNTPVTATWSADSDGNWGNATSWSGGVVPNGAGHVAIFGNATTAPRTITLDADRTVGHLDFTGANAYTLAGTPPLALDASDGNAQVNVTAGSHTITAPLTLADPTTFGIANGSTLDVRGEVTATGQSVTKSGAGTLVVNRLRASSLDVQGGTVRVRPGATPGGADGASRVNTLTVASDGLLDLTNNALVYDYTAGNSPLAAVRTLLQQGRIDTTSGGARGAVGYAEAASYFPAGTTFPQQYAGLSVDDTTLLLAYTILGDATLDRTVSFDDLLALARNYNGTGKVWQQGDFDYDADVDFDDLLTLAKAYNASAPVSAFTDASFAADWALAQSLVPEPATLAAAAGLAPLLPRRRRLVSVR